MLCAENNILVLCAVGVLCGAVVLTAISLVAQTIKHMGVVISGILQRLKSKAIYASRLINYLSVGNCICHVRSGMEKGDLRLVDTTKHIREQELDFMVGYYRNDGLGRLCIVFEEMRQALYDNNRQLWNMIEQLRILQASVAYDLRNPVAIVEGYVEYMQQCLADGNSKRA